MLRRRRTIANALVPVALLAILAAACTAPGGGSTAAPPTAPAATATSAPMETTAAGGVTVEVTQDATFGPILTVDGKSVYLFTTDPAGGAGTACLEACAAAWPPVLVPGGSEPAAGAGLTGTLSTFERPDGGRQVAYAGHPLYFFASDAAPGDTTGQGVGGVWFLLTPAGEAVAGAAATTAPQPTEDDDPYDY